MKNKKLMVLMLAAVMTMGMAAPVYADGYTVSITTEQDSHTYAAYQIFKGDLVPATPKTDTEDAKKAVLSNIEWGTGVNGSDLLADLKSDERFIAGEGEAAKNLFADCNTAAEVAKVLESVEDDSAVAVAFADVVADNLTNVSTPTESAGANKIEGLDAGYYLIKDTTANIAKDDAASRFILQVVDDVTASVKVELPSTDKQIVINAGSLADDNTAGIGQIVSYNITGQVPDYTGYDYYYYVINDTLSDGLTFNNDVTVTVGEKTLTSEEYHLYTGEEADGKTFQVAFEDIMNYTIGEDIVVSYSATVNDAAVIGENGNTNKTNLIYSHNPGESDRHDKTDEPGKPGKDVPTGETPDEVTLTFVTEIDLDKYANNTQTPLAGAEFTLTGTSKQTVLKGGTYYEQDENGAYWLLKDGTYTNVAPQAKTDDKESNEDLYNSTTIKYAKKEAQTTTVTESPIKMVAVSDANGKIYFKGLGEGTYTLEETGVPAGFNKAENVTVVISAKLPETVSDGTEKAEWVKSDSGIYEVEVINKSGSVLPSTGGMGTTLFYSIGGVLVAFAGVLLITKKRMASRA